MNNNLFLITKNNLLTATDLDNGNIIYSYDINEKIAEFLNTKKKLVQIKHLMIINDQIFIFLKNSYILKLNIIAFFKYWCVTHSPLIFSATLTLPLSKSSII